MAKQSRGNPLVFILIAVGVLVAGGFYLVQSGKLSVPVPGFPGSALPRATEADFSFIDDPLVRKHFAAQANVTAYRSRMHDLISQKGSYNVFEIEVRGGGAAYSNWHEDDGKKNAELIAILDTTYVKDYTDGSWWKQTVKPEQKPQNEDEGQREPTDFKDEYSQDRKFTYKKLGEEPCGGLTCYKYEEVDPQNPEAKRIFWFDTGKLLLRKEESGFGEWRSENTYEYDGIRIPAPSPTKDVPEGKNIYEYLYPQLDTGGSYFPTAQDQLPEDAGYQE